MTRPTSSPTHNGLRRLLRILFAAIPISGYGCTGAGRRAQWAIRGCISLETAKSCSLTVLFGLEYSYPYATSAEDPRSANCRIQPGRGTRSRLPRKVEGFMRKALLVVILAGASAFAGTVSGSLSFSNTPLLRPEGESEPAVAVANDGTVAVTGLQWLFNPSFFGTHFWTGPFGSTPTFQGLLDSGLPQPGKIVFGSGDADFDIGSNNTLHATTLMFFINPTFRT